MKYENYYLDLDKLSELNTEDEKRAIHDYYRDMLHCFSDNRTGMATSLFNTLFNNGYLKEVRSEKIEKILS
jgi:hypothetical protein